MNKDGPKLACLKELRLQVILGLRKIKQTNLGRHLKEECKNINWMIKFIISKYNFKISHIETHFLRVSFSSRNFYSTFWAPFIKDEFKVTCEGRKSVIILIKFNISKN